jgi:hypothetical protein
MQGLVQALCFLKNPLRDFYAEYPPHTNPATFLLRDLRALLFKILVWISSFPN